MFSEVFDKILELFKGLCFNINDLWQFLNTELIPHSGFSPLSFLTIGGIISVVTIGIILTVVKVVA